MKVLFVDGPAAGEVRELTGHSAKVCEHPAISADWPPPEKSIIPEITVYRLHRFMIMGVMFNLMSVCLDLEQIVPEEALKWIISDGMKEVRVR